MSGLEFLGAFFLYWVALIASMRATIVKRWLPLFVLGYVVFLILDFHYLCAWQRLLLTSVGLLLTLKAARRIDSSSLKAMHGIAPAHCRSERLSTPPGNCGHARSGMQPANLLMGEILYMTVWPGFDFDALTRRVTTNEDGASFVSGYVCFWLGIFLSLASAMMPVSATLKSWLGIFAILFIVHFGYAVMLGCLMRSFGFAVRPLFDRPELATSLRDFWSRRWNKAFVGMNKEIFVPWFSRRMRSKQALWATFLLSGLLHDLAISYSAGSGFGLPTLYFLIQAAGISVEKSQRKFFFKHLILSRLWTYCWILVPLPLLFTQAFRMQFILPLVQHLANMLSGLSPVAVLSLAIWLAGIGHFCTLIAGLQVPFKFHWKEELARLSRFNQKIMLNYAGYVGLMIVSFGFLTLKLHKEFLYGDKVCVNLAGLIAIFWIVRLCVDFFCFRHDDWPRGPEFVIGHAFLVSLFFAMAGVYSYIVIINCFQLGLKPCL
jgi:alginate O-acetyltransferase complex protein AlgI